MLDKIRLSVIILTSQGDQLVDQAVESVGPAAEIITVDLTGQEITDFAEVRNLALKQAQYDWVFFLDSDEVVIPESWPEIAQIVAAGEPVRVAVKRQDLFLGQTLKHGEAGEIELVRMGRKADIKWQRPVHEVMTGSDPVVISQIKLIHQAHASISSFIVKVGRYAALEAQYRVSQGQSFSLLELLIWPPAKFIYNFIVKLGFLDGWRGLIYALVMSLHSLWVRVNLYELNQKQ